VDAWEDTGINDEVKQQRDALVGSMVQRNKRPSAYDIEYDRPKERKFKKDRHGAHTIWKIQANESGNVFQRKLEEIQNHGVASHLQKRKKSRHDKHHRHDHGKRHHARR
jgi:hypothetical protein